MRIAALYDIHGNLPALEAVLGEVRKAQVDQVVFGGDVLPGPMPVETLACVLSLDIPVQFIRGNGDREVVAAMNGNETSSLPAKALEAIRWTAQQLSADDQGLLAHWPAALTLSLGDEQEVLFCHATPQSDTEIFTRLTPETTLLPAFRGLSTSIVACGHTHMQFDRVIGSTRVLNAGSVGMPFGEPGAYWLLFEPAPKLCHTTYDFAQAAACITETNYPQALDFALHNILQPPSEASMLSVFANAELRTQSA